MTVFYQPLLRNTRATLEYAILINSMFIANGQGTEEIRSRIIIACSVFSHQQSCLWLRCEISLCTKPTKGCWRPLPTQTESSRVASKLAQSVSALSSFSNLYFFFISFLVFVSFRPSSFHTNHLRHLAPMITTVSLLNGLLSMPMTLRCYVLCFTILYLFTTGFPTRLYFFLNKPWNCL